MPLSDDDRVMVTVRLEGGPLHGSRRRVWYGGRVATFSWPALATYQRVDDKVWRYVRTPQTLGDDDLRFRNEIEKEGDA